MMKTYLVSIKPKLGKTSYTGFPNETLAREFLDRAKKSLGTRLFSIRMNAIDVPSNLTFKPRKS